MGAWVILIDFIFQVYVNIIDFGVYHFRRIIYKAG